jgi:hypothetical protein
MATFTTSQLIATLRAHGVEPTSSFEAASGKDYGFVNAWELANDEGFAIEYGNNGETNHDVADDADDLACWLESPDLNALDTIVQTANVRGESDVNEADENTEGPFRILKTRYWYGSTETSDLIEQEFEMIEDAQGWINDAESETYCTSHNESGAPSYKIVSE